MGIVLASQSPRRRELMHLVTPNYAFAAADLDERAITAPTPEELVGKLAQAKARVAREDFPNDVVIGCDTVVDIDGEAIGKPESETETMEMMGRLSGRRHYVRTGICILMPEREEPGAVYVETTAIDFLPLPEDQLAAYAATKEPYDKAGGYGIQGWASRYIHRVEGCYYNVLGLPVSSLYHHLLKLGALG